MSDISDDKPKNHPPPFSIRFTFEEKAKLDGLSENVYEARGFVAPIVYEVASSLIKGSRL